MKRPILMSIALLLGMGAALAHDAKGQNGGRVVDAGDYHVELVAKGEQIEVYLSSHDNKPVPLAGYKGLAILSAGGKSQRIVLSSDDAAKLTGKAELALPAEPKGVVQITPPGGKTMQAKF